MKFKDKYHVEKVGRNEGRPFIIRHHYSGGCHNGPMIWALKDRVTGEMRGACAFATPCSEAVRASVFGKDRKDWVTELHRLVVLRPHPVNLTSWFVARAIKGLAEYRPKIRAILSFADTTEGHDGTIYQATNFHYAGTTGKATFYRDQSGTLRHPRQCGVNIDRAEAKRRGWRPERRDAKHRYVFFVPRSRKERANIMEWTNLDIKEEYP